jgi:Flp pilus assembly protein TadD
MHTVTKNHVPFQRLARGLAVIGLVAVLTSCTMPEKPDGADVGAMTTMANHMRAAGDDAGAVDFYQRALAANPDDITARIALAEILEAHNDNLNAATEYREALKAKPDNGEVHRALGRVLIKLGKFNDAKDEYEKALQTDPHDVKALNGLGVALDTLGQHDAAQNVYWEAMEEKSDDLVTVNNLAHSYVETGAYEQAIRLLEPHVKDKTATPAMRQNLAEAYGMAGMFIDAERMGRMDLTPDQVKHNLDYYHARRQKLASGPALYADLGSFPTAGLGGAAAYDVKEKFPNDLDGLIVEVKSEINAIGGTPHFNLYVTGFASTARLRGFCDKLKREKMTCQAQFK